MKTLRIQNFQAHKDITLELGRVTTITGATDKGKSSILRALRWLVQNRPRGYGFIRHGSKQTRVEVEVDSHTIAREREGESLNFYYLDGQKLTAFGNEVPADVADLLNMSDVNFQGQHDPPFWFMESSGEVSRRLNQIVDLSLIDSTLASIDATARRHKMEVDVLRTAVGKALDEKNKHRWTKKAHKDLREVENLENRWKKEGKKRLILEGFILTLETHQNEEESQAQLLSLGETAVLNGDRWVDLVEQVQKLTDAVENILEMEKTISSPLPNSMDELDEIETALGQWAEQRSSLEDLITRLEEFTSCKDDEAELKRMEERLTREMEKVCPMFRKGKDCPLLSQTR